MIMINPTFQIVLILSTVAMFIITSILIIKRHMHIKYALVWFGLNTVLLIFAIFPQLVQKIAEILHIYSDTNTIFLIMVAILYMLSFSFSIIFSRNSTRIKDLTQALAILDGEVNKLKNEINNEKKDSHEENK